MKIMRFNFTAICMIVFLLFYGCTATSLEFRTAKTATRSEKDLKRGEEWGKKALNVETENALVPYFIATEIYKPQERWSEMAEMLDEAMRRNPEQKLEQPKFLIPPEEITRENYEESILETVGEAVEAYREELWITVYNQAVESMQTKNNEITLEKLNLCLKIDSSRMETYGTLAGYYASNNDFINAKKYINQGLSDNPGEPFLYEMNAKLLLQEYQTSNDSNLLKDAESMYLKAIENSEDPIPLKKQLIFVYIDLNKNQSAIDLSNELLDIQYDDPDLYFNVAVLYQRLALDLYDPAVESFNNLSDENNATLIEELYKNFVQAKDYANKSKEYYLQASDLELEDTGSYDAGMEMRKLAKQLNDIFIPSISERRK